MSYEFGDPRMAKMEEQEKKVARVILYRIAPMRLTKKMAPSAGQASNVNFSNKILVDVRSECLKDNFW